MLLLPPATGFLKAKDQSEDFHLDAGLSLRNVDAGLGRHQQLLG
jgi:hypothetical protein